MSKIALVTGASSGIGQEVAIRLAKDGLTVLVHYHQNEKGALETLEKMKLVSENQSHQLIQFNQSDLKDIEAKIDPIERIDVLVNNAGLHKDAPTLMMENSRFSEVLETNLYGPFVLMKLCGKKMLLNRQGVMVNIASLAGQMGNAGQGNYAASKAGLIALTKTLAVELGSRGIRVNAVSPGLIETEMLKDLKDKEVYNKKIPLGRIGTAKEVANVVAFLCSDEASYITATTINVNGGFHPI